MIYDVPTYTFRQQLSDMLRAVGHDGAVIRLLRYRKPYAVVLPLAMYEDMLRRLEAKDATADHPG